MNNFFSKNKFNIIRFTLLIPIILVSIISISHVTEWYDIANPYNWSVYLSISIEIAAMISILASSLKMKGGAWGIFLIVTFIQMLGNIFFSYQEIDSNGDLFKSWVELTSPVWDAFGTDITDVISLKRWLAFLEGGLLPIISLTSLHFFIKYEDNKPDSTTEQVTVHDTVHDTIHDTPKVESGTQITDWLEEHGSPEIEEMVDYESSQYFDIQENLITNTTTTTTNDGVRRLTYSKPVNLINL
jgi:hypothetical protein